MAQKKWLTVRVFITDLAVCNKASPTDAECSDMIGRRNTATVNRTPQSSARTLVPASQDMT